MTVVQGAEAWPPRPDGVNVGSRRTRTAVVVVVVAAALAVLIVAAAALAVLHAGTGTSSRRLYAARVPAPAVSSTTPSAQPLPSPSSDGNHWLAYPGQPYPGVVPFCGQVDQGRLAPGVFSAPTRDVSMWTDPQIDGTEMKCTLVFSTAPVTGADKLHAWVYADPARAVTFYNSQRTFLTGFNPGSAKATRGDLRGIGQRAYEVYGPPTVSNEPNVHLQPRRTIDLVLLDANLVMYVELATLVPMNASFSIADQRLRDLVHQSVLDIMAKLRSGRPPG